MSKNNSSRRWLHEHLNDPYVKSAKEEGYRSRAAYKLLEIQKRDRIIQSGMRVIDLGAAPGGWSQVAAKIVGLKGQVIAIDLLAITPPIPRVVFLQGDFINEETRLSLQTELGNHQADLVLSDMAPNLTGIKDYDQAMVYELATEALHFSAAVLKPTGHLLIKVFQGVDFEDYLKNVRKIFKDVRIRKPPASRGHSNEIYLLARFLNLS